MKIAISAGDFPETYSLERILDTIQLLKVKYVELIHGETMVHKGNIGFIKEELKKRGLEPSSVQNWCIFTKKDKIKENQKALIESIHIAKAMNVKYVRVGPFGSVKDAKLTKEILKEYKKDILPCIKEAEKEKICIILENEFHDDPCGNALQCLDILIYMDSECFQLLYDPCNFYIAGEEPFPYTYEMLKSYVKYIHIKDARKINVNEGRGKPEANAYLDKEGNSIWKHKNNDYLCVGLKEGGVNYDGLLTSLKNDRYDGFLSIEPHVIEKIHTETLLKNINYMKDRGGK